MNSYRLPFRHDDAVDVERCKAQGIRTPRISQRKSLDNLINKTSVVSKEVGENCPRKESDGG
jgi:hypothetical protein